MTTKTTGRKKTTAKRKTTKKKTSKTTSAKPTRAKRSSSKKANSKPVSPEQRYCMIQDAAYYLAEKEDFNGSSFEHWIEAEMQIDSKLENFQS